MSQFYTLKEVSKMGDPWESHGNQIQSWWGKVEGEDWGVMIGKQVGNELNVGMSLYGDLTKARSKKGNDYWKFKSSQVPEGVERPQNQLTPVSSTLEARVAKLEKMVFGEEPKKEVPKEETDEPLTLEDIPF